MNRFCFTISLLMFAFLLLSKHAYADLSYVLPYPAEMPGSRFYKIQELTHEISKFWYFGSFGKFKYNLQSSDKYLVEAKTLFEYDQFLLGQNSLLKSDEYFSKLLSNINQSKLEGKNISGLIFLHNQARQKHMEVLLKIRDDVPDTFDWQPERKSAITIKLHEVIDRSIEERNIPYE